MIDVLDFEEIRPYKDIEVNKVINELCDSEEFIKLIHYVYNGKHTPPPIEEMRKIDSIDFFQHEIITQVVRIILEKSSKGLTSSGIENLSHEEAYLHISNHRDIILDPSFVNIGIYWNNFPTVKIAIGDNLLVSPTITKLVRLNKSFIVPRDRPPREMLFISKRMSNYIRKSIREEKESCWIAQREGRSKDGNDKTQQGLLKMLLMSGEGDPVDKLKELKISPVSLSYEYDACDDLKTNELYIKQKEGAYQKKPGEDLKSMIQGVEGAKGRIHIHYAKPLLEELDELKTIKNINDQLVRLGEIIDKKIYQGYKLWPSNYIALDLLGEKEEHSSFYTTKEKANFIKYMDGKLSRLNGEIQELRRIFLNIYANPAINQLNLK